MKPFRLYQVAVAVVVSLLSTLNAQAKDAPMIKVFGIKGDVVGRQLRISLEPGPIATKGIVVYSEPSHTLLLIVIDRQYNLTSEGKQWIKQNTGLQQPLALISTDLPSGRPAVEVRARPSADDRITVSVYGIWPGDIEEERLIADGIVGTAGFQFTTSVRASGDPQHCCTTQPCSQMCITRLVSMPGLLKSSGA